MCAVVVSIREKNVTQVKLSDRDVWPKVKQDILDHNPIANDHATIATLASKISCFVLN